MSIVCWGPKAYQRISEMKSGGFVRPQRNRPWSRQHCWRGLLSRCISKHEWVDHVQLKTSVSSCHLISIRLLLFLPFSLSLTLSSSPLPFFLLSLCLFVSSLSRYSHLTVPYSRLSSIILLCLCLHFVSLSFPCCYRNLCLSLSPFYLICLSLLRFLSLILYQSIFLPIISLSLSLYVCYLCSISNFTRSLSL